MLTVRDVKVCIPLQSQYLGMLVYDVHAKDADRGDNGIVDYGFYDNGIYTTATNAFMINSITGVIRAQRVYDREETDRYVVSRQSLTTWG